MKTQHSPAPWQWSQHGPTRCLRDANDATVLTIDNGTLPMPEDARLIAAAPDLLEACKAMLRWMQNCALDTVTTTPNALPECLAAKSAVAKAQA